MLLEPGGRLVFAWGVLRNAPDGGWARCEALAAGRLLYSHRVPARPRRNQWAVASVGLDLAGPTRLELRCDHLDDAGRTIAADGSEPWIAVTPPRLYTRGERRRRILLWVSFDAARADHFGLYGYARATSPNLDRMGSGSVVFDEALATASWTLPSMASQFSSRSPSAHGAVLPSRARDPLHDTLFAALAREGFTVLGVTGNGFISRHFNMADGFDALSFRDGRAEELNALVLRLLEEWPGGDLALFIHYMDPHAEYDPPAPFAQRFDADYQGRVGGRNFEHASRTRRDLEHVIALYDAEIAYTDAQLGALISELRARGIFDAVTVVTADHGEEFQDHGGWTHGHSLHSELLHVPFVLHVPGLAPRHVGETVSMLDLAPTLLDALGVDRPGSFEGRSLLPLLQGRAWEARPIIAETERGKGDRHQIAVRDGGYHYILAVPRGAAGRVIEEALYDRRTDPGESAPLPSSRHLERLRQHALLHLARAQSQAIASSAADVPEELKRQLQALGYVE